VLHRQSHRLELMDESQPHGPALGLFGDAEFPALLRTMAADETWLLYTDGLYEPANAKGESFGMERVQSLLQQQLARPLSEVLDNLMHGLIHFTGAEEVDDDVCLVAIEARNGMSE
jgi:phosphoserine phosphatase RsbU/P